MNAFTLFNITKQLGYFEELTKMQLLFRTYYIKTLPEVKFLFLIFYCCEVPGHVECCFILLLHKGCWHVLEGDHNSRLLFFGYVLSQHFPYDIFGNGYVETLANEIVEPDSKNLVELVELGHTYIYKPFPKSSGFFVSFFKTPEPLTGFIFQFRVLLSFFVKAYIKRKKLLYGVFLYFSLVAPFFVGTCQLAELCSPVAQVIVTDTFVTEKCVDVVQRLADDCCAQVTDG